MEIKPATKTQSICGTCIHFNYIPQFKEVCSKLGIGEFHAICDRYQFNFKLIDAKNKKQQRVLNRIATLDNEQLRIVADLLRAEKQTRSRGFSFGQPVYIHLFGDKYLSNFAKGWVIMVAKGNVYIQGHNSSFSGVFKRKSIIKEAQFVKICKTLAEANKLKDPNYNKYMKGPVPSVKRVEDVPTIDKFVEGGPAKGKKRPESFSTSFTLEEYP